MGIFGNKDKEETKVDETKVDETKVNETKVEAPKKFTALKTGGVEVEFTTSPTGLFKLGYNVGDTASFDDKQAQILIASGVAKKA